MKKYKQYTDAEKLKISAKYGPELYNASRTLYATMPWTFLAAYTKVFDYVTTPTMTSIFDSDDEKLYDTETYMKYDFMKDITKQNETVRNLIVNSIDCKDAQAFTKKRIRKLKNFTKKAQLNNFNFYIKLYGKNNDTFEQLRHQYRDSGTKDHFKREFLNYIAYNQIDKRKQSQKYTVSRDLDKDVYYETTEGRLARIKGYLFKKYMKKGMVDKYFKAYDTLPEGIFVKPMRLINKVMPKAKEPMKLLIASMFEGIKDCHMIIDTQFDKAYAPNYNMHQDTDGDKASNYSCMSGNGELAQLFYGGIHGCKVVRWELDDGTQVGRCIMYEWKGQRHFIRIYGQYEYHRTMINMLEAQMNEGDLFGRNCKIKDIKLSTDFDYDTRTLYLDGNYYGLKEIDGQFYMVADNFDCDCKTTSNDTIEDQLEDYCTCDNCGRRRSNDDGIWIDDYFYCDSGCAEEAGWRCCEHCGDWAHEDDAVWIEGVGYYCCSECANNAGYNYDNYNNEWVDDGDLGDTDDGCYITTKYGAANYYGVEEDEVEWDEENQCWKRPEQEQTNEGEENGVQE